MGGYGENYGQFTYLAHKIGFTRHDDDCILQMHCLHSDIFHMRTKIVPITSNYAPPIQGCNSGRGANHGTGTCGIHRFQRGCARYIAVCERFFSPLLVEPAPQSGRKEYVPSVCCPNGHTHSGHRAMSCKELCNVIHGLFVGSFVEGLTEVPEWRTPVYPH